MDRRGFFKTIIGSLIFPFLPEKDKPTMETLARWWNTLNEWRWPYDMPGKPDGFDEMPNYFLLTDPRRGVEPYKFIVSSPFIERIENIIGMKECLRWHHLYNLDRSNEQFEIWWNSYHKGGISDA